MAKKKDINRFIVFCIEQYASFSNRSSAETYRLLFDSGLIKLLKDDYMDLHGMSFTYLNSFFDEYLSARGLI